MSKQLTKFERDCQKVADDLGIEVDFYRNESGSDCYEDDGVLHIRKRGIRAAFSVDASQDDATEQNERTREILTALNMANKITDRVLVEEEDEQVCPCCGQEYEY